MKPSKILLLAAALAFVGFVFFSLFRTEPVEVSHSRLERQGDNVFLDGAVENTASAEQAVDLEVHYYNSRGREIARDTVPLDDLKSGETRKFHTPERALAGVASFSIYLNHGRNPYGN